jgi:uncharacterized protein YgbK (DUF1537 family)
VIVRECNLTVVTPALQYFERGIKDAALHLHENLSVSCTGVRRHYPNSSSSDARLPLSTRPKGMTGAGSSEKPDDVADALERDIKDAARTIPDPNPR